MPAPEDLAWGQDWGGEGDTNPETAVEPLRGSGALGAGVLWPGEASSAHTGLPRGHLGTDTGDEAPTDPHAPLFALQDAVRPETCPGEVPRRLSALMARKNLSPKAR